MKMSDKDNGRWRDDQGGNLDSRSRLGLMLVRGRRASLSSRTTSVRDKRAGSCFVNRFM